MSLSLDGDFDGLDLGGVEARYTTDGTEPGANHGQTWLLNEVT